jgi:hypothetical protein
MIKIFGERLIFLNTDPLSDILSCQSSGERNKGFRIYLPPKCPLNIFALLGGAAASWPFARSALLNEARPTIEHANLRLIFSEIVPKA